MEEVTLDAAVDQIHQACAGEQRPPFFFMLGAGISFPPIPLATTIETQCAVLAMEQGRLDRHANEEESPLDRYSHLLELAYPHPRLRQRYLRDLMQQKPISHANLRLAHLLSAKKVATLAVTTNFDDFLSRSLDLFGIPHLVCDHPRTVERIDPESQDVQIIHVHGTYWFYDCCNLRGEIEGRALTSPDTTLTMGALLDRILSNRSPLVVGYSGWENDVFMSAVKRRLYGQTLPYKLYWFCYSRASIDLLPRWLKGHPDVSFVVPLSVASLDTSQPTGLHSAARGRGAQIEAGADSRAQVVSDKGSKESCLYAQSVMDKLIVKFCVAPPQIIANPLGFLAKQLGESLPQEKEQTEEPTIYFFEEVIKKIEHAEQLLAESVKEPESGKLEQVRNAIRRSEYREAIMIIGQITAADLEEGQLLEMIEAAWSAARGLNDNSENEMRGYEFVVSLADRLEAHGLVDSNVRERAATAQLFKGITLGSLNHDEEAIAAYEEVIKRFGESKEPALQQLVARALVIKGASLGALNRNEEAIAAYQEVINRFGESKEPALQQLVAIALANKSFELGRLNRHEEEIAAYQEVIERFGESKEPALQEQVARALVDKGASLDKLNRHEEEIAAYEEVIKRLGESKEPALQGQVARALVNKGYRLGVLSRNEEEIAAYQEVIERFGESTEPALQEQVARALFNKGYRLGTLNRNEEAIAACEEVIKRFGESTEPTLRQRVAMALVNKGYRLGALNRQEEAIAVYEEVTKRFGESKEPALQEQAASALVNKGITFRALNRDEEEIAAYQEVIERFGESKEPALQEQVAMALVNKGYRLGTLNRNEETIAAYEEVIKRFGESTEPTLQEQVARALVNKGLQVWCA